MLKNLYIIMQTYWLPVSCEYLLYEKLRVCLGGVKFVKWFCDLANMWKLKERHDLRVSCIIFALIFLLL